MSLLAIALTLLPSASAAPVVAAGPEISVGRVVGVASGASVVVEERRGGVLADTEVHLRNAEALGALRPGDTVLVYREADGAFVVRAQ